LFRYRILLAASISFALLSTFLLVLQVVGIFPFNSSASWNPSHQPISTSYLVLAILQSRSIVLAPAGWLGVLGVWIWRGRTKSEWTRRGLDRSSFKLLLQMKGSQTRVTILKALSTPRDRFQLSGELGLDWTTVDYHVRILLKQRLISEKVAYGNVRLYELTTIGTTLLQTLQDMNNTAHEGAPSSTRILLKHVDNPKI